jgi:hypothetical protein
MASEWIVQWTPQLKTGIMFTRMKTGLFALVALLVAGVSYWAIQPKPPQNRTTVATEPNPGQAAPENSQVTGREQAPPASPAPATASRAPATEAQAPAPGSGLIDQASKPAPPTAAPAPTMPAEDKMSAANRRDVQNALHQRGYYRGAADGIFGPRTRAAIRRFQRSIGAKTTGYLTAAEASRLVSSF